MTQTNGRALFVYYKIDHLEAAALLPLVIRFQQQVAMTWPQLSCELMQRPATSAEGKRTWMEIYRAGDGVSDAAIDGIAALALEMQLPAPRLNEVFMPLP